MTHCLLDCVIVCTTNDFQLGLDIGTHSASLFWLAGLAFYTVDGVVPVDFGLET